MSKLEIDLDAWRAQAMNDDPAEIADIDLECAAEWGFVMLDEETLERTASLNDKINTMRKRPELVAAHAKAHAINRLEHTYRTLKIEELRLLGSIADSLERIASAAESAKGKRDE
ncbi:hypothetical protein [Nitrosomonas sp.]|uniref:hypothetical protein n=1 Tax=Nitrosomonas sp. TaxID=42353 RepID=UPI0025F42AE0|nr:hypothetical protein [Nitrosomonas sp.]MBV6448921.1 hypothetical protein [Nitrosomonas sp.]